MRSPEEFGQSQLDIFNGYIWAVIDQESSRESNKTAIRKAAVDYATNKLNVTAESAAYFATYFYKLLEKDSQKYEKIWDLLHKISQFAENPEAVTGYLTELLELNEGEITYLWSVVHGILRGDYKVSVILYENESTKAQSIALQSEEIKRERSEDLNRRASLKAAKELFESQIIQPDPPSILLEDVEGFDEYEIDIFIEIYTILRQTVDTLLYSSEKPENIKKILEGIRKVIDGLVDQLSCATPEQKLKYKKFTDKVTGRYFDQLITYALELSKPERCNRFFQDILNEPYLINNRLISDNVKETVGAHLAGKWKSLKEKLKLYLNDKEEYISIYGKKEETVKKEPEKAGTEFFYGQKPTPPGTETSKTTTQFFTGFKLGNVTPPKATKAAEIVEAKTIADPEEFAKAQTSKKLTVYGISQNDGSIHHPQMTGEIDPETLQRVRGDEGKAIAKLAELRAATSNKAMAETVLDVQSLDSTDAFDAIRNHELRRYTKPETGRQPIELAQKEEPIDFQITNKSELRLASCKYLGNVRNFYTPEAVAELKVKLENEISPHLTTPELRREFMLILIEKLNSSIENHPQINFKDFQNLIRDLINSLIINSETENAEFIPEAKFVEETRKLIPDVDNYPDLVELLRDKGLYQYFVNIETKLRNLLAEMITKLQLHRDLAKRLTGQPYPEEIANNSLVKLESEVLDLHNEKKKVLGWFSKLFKGRNKSIKQAKDYFAKLDTVIDMIWEEGLFPTFNNFTSIYFGIQNE